MATQNKVQPAPQNNAANKKKKPKFSMKSCCKLCGTYWDKLHISPKSRILKLWKNWVLVWITYDIVALSFRFGFADFSIWWIVLDILSGFFHLIDYILLFFTGFQRSDGQYIREKKKILLNLVTPKLGHKEFRYFSVETVALFVNLLDPIAYIAIFFGIGYRPYHKLIRFLRYFVFDISNIQFFFDLLKMKKGYFTIFKSIFEISLWSHVLACGYFAVCLFEGPGVLESEFVPGKAPILKMDLFSQYLRSLWWAFQQLTGYSNTQPKNDLDAIYTSFVTLLGLFIFVSVIGTVGSIVDSLDSSNSEINKRLFEINTFMNYRNIPKKISKNVTNYYNYLWKSRRSLDENAILEELPVHLRLEVALSLNAHFLEKVPLFQGAEKSFLNSMVLRLIPYVSLPGVYIVRKGEIGREMFFISKGSVEIVSEDGKVVFVTLPAGAVFGEIALVKNTKRTANVRSKGYCDLFIITKNDYYDVLAQFPEQAEKIKKIAEERYTAVAK